MSTRRVTGGVPVFMERNSDDKTESKTYEAENICSSITGSVRKILQMSAETSEEKFKVLDARDKLYKLIRDRDPNLKRRSLVATCPDMCPEKERLLREYQGRGSIFEMTNFSKNSHFNHSLAIKEYARSSADQEEPLPHELRPIKVLVMTMSHLLHNVIDICEFSDDNLEEWYMFVWDRTRALRKELTQQGICNVESVTLVEQCARFHIHCAERLVDQDNAVYDDKINTENLTKCLQTLKYMYRDLAKEDIKCPNEPEFICYSLLLNLNNSSVFTEISNLPEFLLTSEPVRFALNVMGTWQTRNYIHFFNLVKRTTYLNCCLLRRYFGEMRLYAIKTMIRSYCTKNYSPQIPVCRFVQNLNFEGEEECLKFLSQCNFSFHSSDGETVVNFDRVLFQNPKTTLTTGRAYIFIEEKKQKPLSVIMAGGALPELFEDYTPQSSFTESGEPKPESLLQMDLIDFMTNIKCEGFEFNTGSSNRSSPLTLDIIQKEEKVEDTRSQKKEENPRFSSTPLFSVEKTNQPLKNIFASLPPSPFTTSFQNLVKPNAQSSIFGGSGNIFNLSGQNQFTKNIFGNQGSCLVSTNNGIFGAQTSNLFTNHSNSVRESKHIHTTNLSTLELFGEKPRISETASQLKSESQKEKIKEIQKRNDILEKEKLEKEREEKESRRKKEEDNAKIVLENKLLEEESHKKEMEKEKKRLEEERLKKEELVRVEREEKRRKYELAMLERMEEAKRQSERIEIDKRKAEYEHAKKIHEKMSGLKTKVQKWKTKIIFEKWRIKTWTNIEERKMKEYFKEVKLKYPPVCTEEVLDGNPYGLVIPSTLAFERFHNWKGDVTEVFPRKLLLLSNHLPLLNVNSLLGKPLEDRARSLRSKLNPFPWKLVISVPDGLESPEYWKSIETFVEMHFVEDFHWDFGIQKGPLYCQSGCYGSFKFIVSVRRFRGSKLCEGSEINHSATAGSNSLIFFVAGNGNDVTLQRLNNVLKSRPPLPKIPLVIFVLNDQFEKSNLEKQLGLETLKKSYISDYFIISAQNGKQQIVKQFIECLMLSVKHSPAPCPVRISSLKNFLSGTWLDSLWRRIEISLSNFKLNLNGPEVLISFYNSCIDELLKIFLSDAYKDQTVLAEEFSGFVTDPPDQTPFYKNKISSFVEYLKLPRWPVQTPKSSHQLNYRIHQYCKKICGQDKVKLKNVKWQLYQIIRRSLLWKGLDIYCDEDINEIILNFPWIQVFQEISRIIVRQLNEEVDGKILVIYNLERIEQFIFETGFISNFFINFRNQSSKLATNLFENEDSDKMKPSLERDSIVYAYWVAIERETKKRKREEYIDESLDALFSSPVGKRKIFDDDSKNFDYSEMKSNFQNLNDRLDNLKKRMFENSKTLFDIQTQMQ